MVFSSIPFLFFFLPIFFLLYYLVPFQAKNYILLAFSLIFYAWGEPIYVLLMIGSAFLNYVIGILMEKSGNSARKKKLFLILSIIENIGVLGFYKYADFAIGIVNSITGLSIKTLGIALPIGISFFTFQIMSYTIDLYREEVKVEHNFFYFLTYVSMFPQLIAGPIVRFSTVSEELHERVIDWRGFSEGMLRFMQGLFKKVLIANQIGILWETIKAMNYATASISTAWLGAVAFTLQLYFDFSAYSDMAIGMGRMLGFHYMENFQYPLSAISVTDFWRRWHISLSTWFRDYIYIPLGGSRKGIKKHLRNIAVVWLLTGLWHGAAWNFVLWGVYYGILLMLEKYVWGNGLKRIPKCFQHIYAIGIVVIGFTIFVFDDLGKLTEYAKLMLGMTGSGVVDMAFFYYLTNYGVILLIALVFSMPFYPWIQKRIAKLHMETAAVSVLQVAAAAGYIGLLAVTTAYLVGDTYNPFLYFRF